MIAKELILTITGYNLVRAVMNVAAEQNDPDPRRLSFSRSQDVVNAALPGLDGWFNGWLAASCPTAANGHRARGPSASAERLSTFGRNPYTVHRYFDPTQFIPQQPFTLRAFSSRTADPRAPGINK